MNFWRSRRELGRPCLCLILIVRRVQHREIEKVFGRPFTYSILKLPSLLLKIASNILAQSTDLNCIRHMHYEIVLRRPLFIVLVSAKSTKRFFELWFADDLRGYHHITLNFLRDFFQTAQNLCLVKIYHELFQLCSEYYWIYPKSKERGEHRVKYLESLTILAKPSLEVKQSES